MLLRVPAPTVSRCCDPPTSCGVCSDVALSMAQHEWSLAHLAHPPLPSSLLMRQSVTCAWTLLRRTSVRRQTPMGPRRCGVKLQEQRRRVN